MSDLNLLRHSLPLPPRPCNSLLAGLPAPDKALLVPLIQDVHLTRASVLYEAGDPIDHVYFPHTAVICRIADLEGVITAVAGREAACGVGVALDLPRALNRAAVLNGGTAASITAADFRNASLKSNALREVAARCTALLLSQLHQTAACNTHHSLEGRLSRWLLECSDRVGGEVRLTQSALALLLGARQTSIALVARDLQSSGAISYCRGVIHILNRPMLETSACECYRTVRWRADRLASNRLQVG